MREINSFIISFCVSSIGLGFLYLLCPNGSMSAIVKYVFCLCFVCCVIGAVVVMPNVDLTLFENKQETNILTEQNVAITAQTIFCEALRKQNINFKKVIVKTNKLGDDSIVISKIYVYTDEPTQKITDTLASDDYEVVVINE